MFLEKLSTDGKVVAVCLTSVFLAHLVAHCFVDVQGAEHLLLHVHIAARCSFVLFFATFLAAPLRHFMPGSFTQWLYERKRGTGLSFAASHFLFAAFVTLLYLQYEEQFVERVGQIRLISGLIGFAMITGMTLTSFLPIKRLLTVRAWRVLHGVSLYSLAAAFVVNYSRQSFAGGNRVFLIPLAFAVGAYVFRLYYVFRRNRSVQRRVHGKGNLLPVSVDSANVREG